MKSIKYLFLLTLIVGITACSKDNPDEDSGIETISLDEFQARGGNGAPSGGHFNLNIIGVPKEKTADMTGNSGRRIFVDLDGPTKIYLQQGEFAVLDANGTDGRAEFQLPAPGNYAIFVRPLGTPGGQSTTTTCATYETTDADTGEVVSEEVCSMNSVVQIRERNRPKFVNVTKDLTQIEAAFRDTNGDGAIDESDIETVDLFDELLFDYFWNYDNKGLKVLQMRFYEI